jgi:tetratricopeptide (TPR) repeat protein
LAFKLLEDSMPRLSRSFLLALLPLPSLLFAQTDVRTVVIAAQPTRYEPAGCGIKTGHFKVGSGATYLSTAITNEANRPRLLSDAEKVLIESIRDNGQAGNAAAWYYLGRVYLYEGNVLGADTAFTRAETLAPACKDEILGFRRATAAALQEPAGLFLQAEKNDSALAIYRLATTINPAGTNSLMAVGTLFETMEKPDSAIVYFRRASSVGAANDRAANLSRSRMAGLFAMSNQVDSAVAYYTVIASSAESAGDTDARNSATLNMGAVLYNGKRYQEAIPVLRRYLVWRPDQMSARQYLASAYRESGQVDSADAVMRASGVAVGVSGGPDTVSAAYLINRGAARFQANEHAKAAEDFERALQSEPNNRLALRNLAATYYTLKNGPKLAEIAGRIVALEPLSETARRLQNQGYIWVNPRDPKLEGLVDQLDAMPVSLENVKVQISATGATASGTATGRAAMRNGAAVAPAPVTVVFEFLNASGTPVTTTEVVIPVLMAGLPGPVSATASGQAIVDWRYRVK